MAIRKPRGGRWNPFARYKRADALIGNPTQDTSAATKGGNLPMPTGMQTGLSGIFGFDLSFGRTGNLDFRTHAGDTTLNSAVSACLYWIVTSWPQAPYQAVKPNTNGSHASVPHRMIDLLTQPSPFYSGKWLSAALLTDWWTRGNAYAYMVPPETWSGEGNYEPVGLQWLPEGLVWPRGTGNSMITHYEYRPGVGKIDIPFDQIMHFRFGVDRKYPLRGRAPLQSADPEIATDNEATIWQWTLLRKGGVPPWIAGPDGKAEDGMAAIIDEDDALFLKKQIAEKTQGENRGDGLVMPKGFKLEKLGFDPKSMVVGETQKKAEERIAAQFGLPPVVAGLGAGLDRSTYNNYEEARQAAWEDCIIPTQDYFADEYNAKLKPRYKDAEKLRVGFDRSGIRCLRDDESAKVKDAALAFEKGIIDRATAKQRIGIDPDPEDVGVYASQKPEASGAQAVDDGSAGTSGGTGGGKGFIGPFVLAPGKARRRFPAPTKNLGAAGTAEDPSTATLPFRARLLAREQKALAEMSSALDVAEAAVRVKLDELLARIEAARESGENVDDSWLMGETRYISLLMQIDAERDALADTGGRVVAGAQRDYAALAERSAQGLTAAALGPVPEGVSLTWNRLPVAKLESLIGRMSDGTPLGDYLKEVGTEQGHAVRDALIRGVTLGSGTDTMRRDVQKALDGQRTRAERIARTEPMRAGREAQQASFAANRDVVNGWIWTSACDLRTCASCWAMHGTLHALGEPLDDHVCGRCVAIPAVKSWGEITGDHTLPDNRPTVERGDDRFAALTAEQQQAILGPGLYELYSGGTATLGDMVTQERDSRWGTQRRAATVREATANANAARA